MKTRKLSPVSASKLIATNEAKTSGLNEPAADSKPNDEAATTVHGAPGAATSFHPALGSPAGESNENRPTETQPAECKTDEIDLRADERMSDPEAEEQSDDKIEPANDSKDDSREDSRDDPFEKVSNYDKEPEAGAPFGSGKRPVQLNIDGLLGVINELKSNKSRVTKISVEKCFQRRNTSLPKNEITEYINRCINQEVVERVKYRDYYGIRMKASFKNGKKSPTDEPDADAADEIDKLSVNDKCSVNDKSSSIVDQDAMSNPDNLSECSLNVNTLNEDLEEDAAGDGSGYNTKKSSLKRCTPTIRYMLRTASEDGVSAADMLKSLQNKRILILYDLKKFVWLLKTYFVDKGKSGRTIVSIPMHRL